MVMKTKIGAVFALHFYEGESRWGVNSAFKRHERKHGVKFGRRRKIETENQFGTKVTIYETTVVRLT